MGVKVREFTSREQMLRWLNEQAKTCNIDGVFHQIVKTDSGYEVFYRDFY